MFPFDNCEQITKVSSTPPTQTATTVLPNLLHSPLFPTHTPSHHKQPTRHSIHPSLTHHHIHVYLTILLQIQLANQSPPPSSVTSLLVLGQPLVLPLLLLIWPVSKMLPTLPLLTDLFLPPILCLWQIFP